MLLNVLQYGRKLLMLYLNKSILPTFLNTERLYPLKRFTLNKLTP